MVSLPELDSEIGVLRFLKWKTRLLALDVIRASGRAYINSIDDVQEPASDDPEVSSSLEQQDDAAVVKLALSKLNPRHREVLIASMYEEKSTEQIAAQVGLSENATRQLIFRARAAFKKALIGDVDTTGMSAAAILSVAARKAAQESKKIGASAMALIALVVMSLTMWPAINRTPADQLADAPMSQGYGQQSPETSNQLADGAESVDAIGIAPTPENGFSEGQEAVPSPAATQAQKDSVEQVLKGPALDGVMGSDSASKLFVLDQDYEAVGDNGLTAKFTFNPTSTSVFTAVSVKITLQELVFDFKPVSPLVLKSKNQAGLDVYTYTGQAPYLFDEFGQKWTETDAKNATFKLEVTMEADSTTVKQVTLALLKAN